MSNGEPATRSPLLMIMELAGPVSGPVSGPVAGRVPGRVARG
jgi:hypothetical protein